MILENQTKSFPSDKLSSKNEPQDNSKHRNHHHHHRQHHHHPLYREPRCHGCGCVIGDREFLSAGELQWHSKKCLKCDQCGASMQIGSKCVVNGDQIFCCHDHKRLFGKRCRKCDSFLSEDDFVVRASTCDLYHVSCFVCEVCLFRISSGQQYGQVEGRIFCKLHFESFFTSRPLESPPFCIDSTSMPSSSVQPINQFNTPPSLDSSTNHSLQEFDLQANQSAGYNYNENARCRTKRKKTSSTEDSFLYQQTNDPFANEQFLYRIADDNNPVEFQMSGDDYQFMKEGKNMSTIFNNNNNRQKRLRTSFKHHQLRTMKNHFSLNHNPDAKELKELAQKTGLTKRILQVWFQNARAKFRRNIMKQEISKGEDGADRPSSITDKSLTSSESPHGAPKMSPPNLSDVSSMGHHFDEEDDNSDLGRAFLNS